MAKVKRKAAKVRKVKKYVRTNAPTTTVLARTKNRLNITGLLVTIAYRNMGKWLTVTDFVNEAAKDGVMLDGMHTSVKLASLSGNSKRLLPEYQRDELLRKPAEAQTRVGSGNIPHWAYMFNVNGTVRIKQALDHTRVNNITLARFISPPVSVTRI